jgi:hypothetical protein
MSVQSAESKAISELSASSFGIGLLCGIGLIFGWGALLDVLQIPFVPSFNKEADLSTRLLSLLHTAPDSGFMLGMYVIMWRKVKTPFHKLIVVTTIWGLVGGLFTYSANVYRVLLETSLGEMYGGLVYAGSLGGLMAYWIASVAIVSREQQPVTLNSRRYFIGLAKLSRAGAAKIALWTVDGLLIGLAAEAALSKSNLWQLLVVPIAILTLITLWSTLQALAADRVRRVRTLRSLLALVMTIISIALLASNSILAVPFALAALLTFVFVAHLNEHSQPSSNGGHDVSK